MMSTGPHPEKLAVQRVGEPGPRVPITGMGGPKRPFDIVPFEAPQNMRVGRDVFVIIVIDEVEMQHRPVNGERQKQQCQANQAWRREGLGSVHRLAETETFHSRADFASRHKPSRRCVWAATSFAGQHTATVAPASSSAPNRLEPSWPPRRCRVFCVSPTAFVPAFCESCMARHYSRATNNSEPKSAVSGHLTCGLFPVTPAINHSQEPCLPKSLMHGKVIKRLILEPRAAACSHPHDLIPAVHVKDLAGNGGGAVAGEEQAGGAPL